MSENKYAEHSLRYIAFMMFSKLTLLPSDMYWLMLATWDQYQGLHYCLEHSLNLPLLEELSLIE
jgi:hypothetical protein